MPKMKSHSGAKKRFSFTKNGKIKHKKAGLRHLMSGMKPARGRKLRHQAVLSPIETNAIKKFLPYG
ncbi:MAG TPA: 50S ribosomal protein L35 [Elusimicrobia bacterium]|nr:MAG: 50S ribosomal protein L35 [Elusimicrobia bacterium RIFOXYA12_FULL_49_49]OGS06169.1 MAG: 50S ribosomal protein L35 [Elusimicrobia bacterium RIFOXYA1_FULL_47_7]OGS11009.1 MAG: 50S ribosomal protein L35 [Elusimicrobia bacterium RIFOXYB1_FULL_48_9]OGS15154.1 MAG: 50S ribosomal protein L35 [Elusimicrobia bacterium RIFOXYA2_FULL_47_53]OGS29774.1 MAG: 50S ribosomal protein L35 [Elusimicrobia bacterium RIFOXYB2_FULL_46_23]HBU70256.1 50S ribosomal protein L35 [Elusimicrobiota bacterium]